MGLSENHFLPQYLSKQTANFSYSHFFLSLPLSFPSLFPPTKPYIELRFNLEVLMVLY